MRISDWSSDVCSSDLCPAVAGLSLRRDRLHPDDARGRLLAERKHKRRPRRRNPADRHRLRAGRALGVNPMAPPTPSFQPAIPELSPRACPALLAAIVLVAMVLSVGGAGVLKNPPDSDQIGRATCQESVWRDM